MAELIHPEKLAELKSLGGDDLITTLLEKYIENAQMLLNEAESAIGTADAEKIDYCIHTLKGSSLSLGLEALSEILVPLNQRTKAQELEGMADSLKQLRVLLEEVVTYKQQHFP